MPLQLYDRVLDSDDEEQRSAGVFEDTTSLDDDGDDGITVATEETEDITDSYHNRINRNSASSRRISAAVDPLAITPAPPQSQLQPQPIRQKSILDISEEKKQQQAQGTKKNATVIDISDSKPFRSDDMTSGTDVHSVLTDESSTGGSTKKKKTAAAAAAGGGTCCCCTKFCCGIIALLALLAFIFGLGFGLGSRATEPVPSVDPPAEQVPPNITDPNATDNNGTVAMPPNTSDPPREIPPKVNGTNITTTIPPIGNNSTNILTPYADCAELEQDLLEAARFFADTLIDYYAESWYQWGSPETELFFGDHDSSDDEDDTATAPNQAGSGGLDDPNAVLDEDHYFETNNQEFGVDEPDVVKSDGDHIFAAYGNDLVILDANDIHTVMARIVVPALRPVAGSDLVELEGRHGAKCDSRISSMLLSDRRLTVITSHWCDSSNSHHHHYGSGDDGAEDTVISDNPTTRTLVYDVSNPSQPALLSNRRMAGRYVSARAVESTVHIMTNTRINVHEGLSRYLSPKQFHTLREDDYRGKAREAAERRIPIFVAQLIDNLEPATGIQCTDILHLSLLQSSTDSLEFANNNTCVFHSLSVVQSFDMAATAPNNEFMTTATGVFFPQSDWSVYSSSSHMVLAAKGWSQDDRGDFHRETYLIGFETDQGDTTPVAVGSVPGCVVNQFAMDHQEKDSNDYLRVATSSVDPDSGVLTNTISVLQFPKHGDDEPHLMEIVGQLEDIGNTEEIYSVRFSGDRGFIVTFLLTDPLHTLDLSDPTNPRIVGELEVPGFSSYIHEISDDLILGVGQQADPSTGTQRGLQVSLFDVSDFANPRRIHNYVAEDMERVYSSSSVQYDHKAFRYLPDTNTLILPVQILSWTDAEEGGFVDRVIEVVGGFIGAVVEFITGEDVFEDDDVEAFDGFHVYSVDASEGIERLFTITHASASEMEDGCWSRHRLKPRSLVFGNDGGSDLVTLKGHTVVSYDLELQRSNAARRNLDADVPPSRCYPYFEWW